jgi:predicted extracellular nuclease
MNRILISFGLLAVAACGGSGGAPVAPGLTPTGEVSVADIQGAGSTSPKVGQTLTFTAIVTGDFQEADDDVTRNLGGFYVQQEFPDADAATSEGIFIFDGDAPATDVNVGDRVRISGVVGEYFGETQISPTSVTVVGTGLIRATDINFPINELTSNSGGDNIPDLERYEGMLVRFPQKLTVSSLRFLGQYGEVELSQGGRTYQFTNSNKPDASAYKMHRDAVALRSIILDDGLRSSNPSDIRHLNASEAADYSIRAGDSLTGATGNLRYSRGSRGGGTEGWRLEPTGSPMFADDNPRPPAPSVAGAIRIASFNVQNFFSKVDNGKAICGPDGDDNCRGANSAAELSRQLRKISTAIAVMDADIIGLIELENNASDSISMIVDAVNSRIGDTDYAYVDTGTIHSDGIKTGFIYDSNTVRTIGDFAVLKGSVDSKFIDTKNRPALAQTFEVIATDAVVTVVVNHLKSKGSSCDSIGDPNMRDGQANCNQTRTSAAAALADWANSDPTASGDADVLIIGDLNAHIMEDPLTALKSAGLTNLLEAEPNAYSYVFDAQAGALDHALASASLVPQVRETIEWHINADEPQLHDYNLEHGRDAELFDPDTPYRASDHDPVIIGLDLSN